MEERRDASEEPREDEGAALKEQKKQENEKTPVSCFIPQKLVMEV